MVFQLVKSFCLETKFFLLKPKLFPILKAKVRKWCLSINPQAKVFSHICYSSIYASILSELWLSQLIYFHDCFQVGNWKAGRYCCTLYFFLKRKQQPYSTYSASNVGVGCEWQLVRLRVESVVDFFTIMYYYIPNTYVCQWLFYEQIAMTYRHYSWIETFSYIKNV